MSVGLSVLAQRGICFDRFWSSDKLTGNQTLFKLWRGGDCFGAVTN